MSAPLDSGMGSVLQCHSQLSEDVRAAVKVLKSHALGDFKRRFVGEMRLLSQLDHPSIPPVYGVDRDDTGAAVYTMKLVRGETLTARIAASRKARSAGGEVPSELRLDALVELLLRDNRHRGVGFDVVLVDCPRRLRRHWQTLAAGTGGRYLDVAL